MINHKYVALDVHKSTISAQVQNHLGKTLMKSIIETNSNTVRDFISSISGTLHVTFEVGCHSAWLFDLINPLVAEVLVCDPRKNKLLKDGNKSDSRDTDKLLELFRLGSLRPVFQGPSSLRSLKELVHCYDSLVSDSTRIKNRIKAIFRGRGLPSSGQDIYRPDRHDHWLSLLDQPGSLARACSLFQQLDFLTPLVDRVQKQMIAEARHHHGFKTILTVPALGPVRVAEIIAAAATPFRFRTKRQFWAYCGLGVITRSSADYHFSDGRLERKRRPPSTRGLNPNHNHRLKYVFKCAAVDAINRNDAFKQFYQRLIDNNMRPEMARLNVARKLAAITLALWKSGESYDETRLIADCDPKQAPGT